MLRQVFDPIPTMPPLTLKAIVSKVALLTYMLSKLDKYIWERKERERGDRQRKGRQKGGRAEKCNLTNSQTLSTTGLHAFC